MVDILQIEVAIMKKLTEDKRQVIVECAAEAFQEKGYKWASMSEIAKRVPCSKATLYNYFSSKEILFETVVRAYSTHFLIAATSKLSNLEHENLPLDKILTLFGEHLLYVLTDSNTALLIYRMVIAEAGNSEIGNLYQESGPKESIEKLAVFMKSAMNKGELIKSDPNLRAVQFMSLLTAETSSMLMQRTIPKLTKIQIKRMVKHAVQLFIFGAAAK